MQLFKKISKIVLSILPVVFFFCSNSDKIAGTVDDTDTGISVYLPDSTPAVDAVIKFIPSSRSQTTVLSKKLKTSSAAVAVVKTDSAGKFKIPALADSTYNIFMEKGDLKAFQGDVVITSQGNTIHDDTLRKTGSFSATVGLDPKDMHNVGSVAVQILGSDVQYLNPDKKGSFTFKDIAPGSYKLRLETSLPEYSPTYFNMSIKSNVDSIYPDTIFIKYNGIPSVHGLSAQFDTSNGIVKLSWDSTEYSNILDYVVFRDEEPTVTYSAVPYKATSATTLVDTIFDIHKTPTDTQTLGFKYRVAIRNNSTVIGNTFGAVSVTATPYKSVLPQIDSIKVHFDTLSGTANVSWITSPVIDSSYSYFITRIIKIMTSSGIIAELQNADTLDTIGYLSSSSLSDSLFSKKLSFNSHSTYAISYTISVFKKDWKLYGRETKSDSLVITPYKNRVPQITQLTTSFDTLHGVASVSWDSIPVATGVSKYKVIRTLTWLLQPSKIDTLPISAYHAFIDTIYPKLVTFDEISQVKVSYTISAFHSVWNIYGLEKTITDTVFSYKAFPPKITAGMDQTVDISSDVLLVGRTVSATFPVIKREWKIGDSAWVVGEDSVQFRTNSEFNRETIPCIFRVTDSVGNAATDTSLIVKTPIVTDLGKTPARTNTYLYTVKKNNSTNEYLVFQKNGSYYGVWETLDFKSYTLLNDNTGITFGTPAGFMNAYYVFNLFSIIGADSMMHYGKSYRSIDGITWSEIFPVFPNNFKNITNTTSIVNVNNAMFSYLATDYGSKLFRSQDGINWDTVPGILPSNITPSLSRIGDTLFISTSKPDFYKSSNGGVSWQKCTLWNDMNFQTTDYYNFKTWCSDSVTLAIVEGSPTINTFQEIAYLKNGAWYKISPDLNIFSIPILGPILTIQDNRCIFVDYPCRSTTNCEPSVKSVKLY